MYINTFSISAISINYMYACTCSHVHVQLYIIIMYINYSLHNHFSNNHAVRYLRIIIMIQI